MSSRTLKEILDSENVGEDADDDKHLAEIDLDESEESKRDQTLCSECQDMRIEVECKDCQEGFCGGCFQLIHHGGKRKSHDFVKLFDDSKKESETANGDKSEDADGDVDVGDDVEPEPSSINEKLIQSIKSQVKFIPMRLTYEERHLLQLLEAALSVSEYTDKVDILSYTSKSKRIVAQLKEMCSVLAGLVVASNLKIGQALIQNKNFEDNAEWYKSVFEIGRRYKIMNPERMRSTFGKLCYMVMDSRLPEIESHMEFHLYKPIKTVYSYLSSKPGDNGKALRVFDDELIIYATAEISPVGKSRSQVQREIKTKENAIEKLSARYSSPMGFSKEDIRQVLYSIGDFNAYTHSNRKPILRFLERLERFQDPAIAKEFNLGIQYGRSGSRLTHDHHRQFEYVKQSLTLWSVIQREMIHLWSIADDDLFNGSHYKLTSTGQGLHRVKACPSLYKEMYRIIAECKSKCSSWIGSSVVHLGDDAVPNALFFLDKYTQVPNILIPIDQCLLKIPDLDKDLFTKKYIDEQFGSSERLQLTILQDAFAHMFDGSGADNFYMSGSCIDGRLTSAWNHTNQIAKKPYYNIFLLTGFIGFNGSEGF
ncbi:uncharacterized protein CYBJADRAFT_146238 [Cyberlindnera jadinii NRRL Y-1542]|uniref:B box-type domain-containing protein n=1 Tax=Cyberlindnera jadinii (strain ATCC 18201 / CBS 1600 / BCRC 20928 / JCM 3617 / NBRC 0987 / NRRL Y-1542) TaxID=983966 RepID=A0A1E4S9Y4_CYBJN|nr:hypothetical protein CYBJADRAFT_146238 [Cyberlindnera jadinii NRRL Y-1542]ODV76304.1 hypothetical protein CYBJADRAFT_146238 [Cyberlindnera jadinii NRRL Y-1542]